MGRSPHKQMAINMASAMLIFASNLCISFFLTPFIINKLGTAAYGFIGLSNNIIGYTGLLTVAVNSMAGRFITIRMHERDYTGANIYLSSIFYTNVILALIIMTGIIIIDIFLPSLINISPDLVNDVRILLLTMAFSSCFSLVISIISVSTFIKNRLDYSNLRSLIGTLIRVTLMLFLFGFCVPHLWYFGMAAMIMEIYVFCTNLYFFKTMTPELKIQRSLFRIKSVLELTAAGAWNVISRLSEILSRGFDLLFANIFINAYTMGLLSICSTLPSLVLSFFGTITANFAPEMTRLYAIKNIDGLKHEFFTAIKITGFFACIPLAIIFAYSDIFYALWLPTENAQQLYYLTICASFGMIFGMPQEPLWNIFTITNKVKKSSLNLLYNSIASFTVILICMLFVEDNIIRLFVLASTRSFFGSIRCVTFLPSYGARCLNLPKRTFYPLIIKNTLNIILLTLISLVIKSFLLDSTWQALFFGCLFTLSIGAILSSITILGKNERTFILNRLKISKS